MTQGLQPASTGEETAEQVVWLEGPERGRRMPNIKVNLASDQYVSRSWIQNTQVFSGSSHADLTNKVCDRLGIEPGKVLGSYFMLMLMLESID